MLTARTKPYSISRVFIHLFSVHKNKFPVPQKKRYYLRYGKRKVIYIFRIGYNSLCYTVNAKEERSSYSDVIKDLTDLEYEGNRREF